MLIWAVLILVFGGAFIAVWTVASFVGFVVARRRESTNGMIGWMLSLMGCGITLAFYSHWAGLVIP